jgi:hypothetical protein
MAVVTVALLFAGSATRAQAPESDLTKLNIEDLMKVEVTSVRDGNRPVRKPPPPFLSSPRKTSAVPVPQTFPI